MSQQSSNDKVASAITYCFVSPNECDSNWENANVVDGLFAIARALDRIAKALDHQTEKEAAQ